MMSAGPTGFGRFDAILPSAGMERMLYMHHPVNPANKESWP